MVLAHGKGTHPQYGTRNKQAASPPLTSAENRSIRGLKFPIMVCAYKVCRSTVHIHSTSVKFEISNTFY